MGEISKENRGIGRNPYIYKNLSWKKIVFKKTCKLPFIQFFWKSDRYSWILLTYMNPLKYNRHIKALFHIVLHCTYAEKDIHRGKNYIGGINIMPNWKKIHHVVMWNWQLFKDWIFKYIWEKRKIEQRVKERENMPSAADRFSKCSSIAFQIQGQGFGQEAALQLESKTAIDISHGSGRSIFVWPTTAASQI